MLHFKGLLQHPDRNSQGIPSIVPTACDYVYVELFS